MTKEEKITLITSLISNLEFHILEVQKAMESPVAPENYEKEQPDLNAELNGYMAQKSFLEGLMATLMEEQ